MAGGIKMDAPYHPSDYIYTRFLNSSGISTLTAAPSASPRYGVALFGLGRAGSIHLSNLLRTPRFRILYIVENNLERLKQAKQNYCLDDSVQLLSDSQAATVFSDGSVTAVVIATPSARHEDLTSAALQSGKHVLCEKPVALSLDLVKRCYSLAKQHERILLCAFNRRYDPAFEAVAAGVRAGRVGQLQSISTLSRDSPSPNMDYLRQSGGIFHDCIVHDVDLICHTAGEFPSKVFAVAHAFNPEIDSINDHDTVVITMKFPSGLLAHVEVSRHAVYGYDQRLEVHGSKGMLKSENQRPHGLLASTAEGCTQVPIWHTFPSRYSEAFLRQTDHFLALLDGTEQLTITEQVVVSVTKIIDALDLSLKTEAFVTVQY